MIFVVTEGPTGMITPPSTLLPLSTLLSPPPTSTPSTPLFCAEENGWEEMRVNTSATMVGGCYNGTVNGEWVSILLLQYKCRNKRSVHVLLKPLDIVMQEENGNLSVFHHAEQFSNTLNQVKQKCSCVCNYYNGRANNNTMHDNNYTDTAITQSRPKYPIKNPCSIVPGDYTESSCIFVEHCSSKCRQ